MKLLKNIIIVVFLPLIVMFINITVYNGTNRKAKLNSFTTNASYADAESAEKDIKYYKEKSTNLIYILLWTSSGNEILKYMRKGRQRFIDNKCPYTNCFVTNNRKKFGRDLTKFDVIVFATKEVVRMKNYYFPKKRSSRQKYVFASRESSDYYPVCSSLFDRFFNWTWTYRLDSEVKWDYMVVKDKENNVVGPQKDMNWIKFEDMDPVSDKLKQELSSKTKAAAWFVSNCHSKSKREVFVKDLEKQLERYDLAVDVYGKCGPLKCSHADESACFDLIKENYYFYLSFENSFDEDYVTEKLLNAVQHYAVPIVFGGANYTRFLPEHSYLDARELEAEYLAARMNLLIENPDEYFEYFRWTKYYSFHRKIDSVETDVYCQFCEILNNETMMKERTVYQSFRKWWDPPNRC